MQKKSIKVIRRELRVSRIRVFEELRGRGYYGSYDAVRRYARSWAKDRGAVTASAFVPLSFAAGEAYQFDWSHEIVVIGGVTITVKVAHVRRCHRRMFFVRAYPLAGRVRRCQNDDRAADRLTHHCTSSKPATKAGASKTASERRASEAAFHRPCPASLRWHSTRFAGGTLASFAQVGKQAPPTRPLRQRP